jgi:hypothetical protein
VAAWAMGVNKTAKLNKRSHKIKHLRIEALDFKDVLEVKPLF